MFNDFHFPEAEKSNPKSDDSSASLNSLNDKNLSRSNKKSEESSLLLASNSAREAVGAQNSSIGSYDYEESNEMESEELQALEQENAMMYNELQSTHEEVKQITRQARK